MPVKEGEMLRRLGAGQRIDEICRAAGISEEEFHTGWAKTTARRLPRCEGSWRRGVSSRVEIERDEWGIPHIYAENDEDLFFGFGLATAQDRLFQLDYLRRKASGRLAEVLGREALSLDVLARTVGLPRIARMEWERLAAEPRKLLTAYSAGINAVIDDCRDEPPVEFDLLDYRPEPWSGVDCLAIETELRWYLTGRFPVIVMPELAKRALGDGPLYREFLLGEADEETILPRGSYALAGRRSQNVGQAANHPDPGTGSNNWVVSGALCASGSPMVAGDPHIAIEAVSCWYEAHLSGGSFDVAGMGYVGMPAILVGRNRQVAWAITNNICSLRDLYQEKSDPAHPGCFLYDGYWEPASERTETIAVRGAEPVSKTIRSSRNGPIVDEILPPPGNRTGPVSLRWLGAEHDGWLDALLAMNRATDVAEFVEAMRPWHVPTFCLVFADVAGRIGFKATGRIPIRRHPERGYRPGWDPEHQWDGLIPFEGMPGVLDPPQGWMATANHRIANDDFPYPLSGTWIVGYRGQRIRQMIEERKKFARADFVAMHQDALSLRAAQCVPPLLRVIESAGDERARRAGKLLAKWDHRSEVDRVGPTIFNVFFACWAQVVAAERFDPATAELLAKGADGASSRLLETDAVGWFTAGDREKKIRAALDRALDQLIQRLGPDMEQWTWGRLHRLPLRHVLSTRGDLGRLLDHGGDAVKGDIITVCNTGLAPDGSASTGAGYRMIADLGAEPAGLWAIDAQSQSGNPASPHYRDQFSGWQAGGYHFLSLDRAEASKRARTRLTLEPAEPG